MALFDINKIQDKKNHFIIEKIIPEKKVGSIHVLNTQEQIEKGTVVKCATPNEQESELEIGDVVFFPYNVGSAIEWNKKEYLIIKEDDILGKEEI